MSQRVRTVWVWKRFIHCTAKWRSDGHVTLEKWASPPSLVNDSGGATRFVPIGPSKSENHSSTLGLVRFTCTKGVPFRIEQKSVTVTPTGTAKKCHCKRMAYTLSLSN